jgi:hypothetical protein
MMNRYFFSALSCLLLSYACNNSPGINEQSNTIKNMQYELVKNWPHLPAGFVLGDVTGVGIDTATKHFYFSPGQQGMAISLFPYLIHPLQQKQFLNWIKLRVK